jgi:hypothetical protein
MRVSSRDSSQEDIQKEYSVRRKRMVCPSCRAGCSAEDTFCRRCGADLSAPSKSLVPIQSHLPTVLQNPQLPRLAAGVGAVAVGVGLELVRRGLLTRLLRPARSSAKKLPAVSPNHIRDLFAPAEKKPVKLPKGYEIHETVVYMSRVIRRED